MGKLDTVIHKNESHRLKMQRNLVVVILYGSIYTSIKLQKIKNCKYHKIISVGNNFVKKIVPNTDNFMMFVSLYIYNFILV